LTIKPDTLVPQATPTLYTHPISLTETLSRSLPFPLLPEPSAQLSPKPWPPRIARFAPTQHLIPSASPHSANSTPDAMRVFPGRDHGLFGISQRVRVVVSC